MATQVRILGWKVSGLRCPDYEVSFEIGKVIPKVSLIQMPNGTGKTTTLDLLRASLSGQVGPEYWPVERVMQFRKKGGASQWGTFQVQLLFGDKRYTFTLTFDFELGKLTCATTLPNGKEEGFHAPDELARDFFNPDFINFLVFDGELAERFLDRKQTNAQAAIESLFHLTRLKDMSIQAERYWTRAVSKKSGAESKSLTLRRERVNALRKLLTIRQSEFMGLKAEESTSKGELEKLRATFDMQLEANKREKELLHQAELKVQNLDHEFRAVQQSVLLLFRSPVAVSETFAANLIAFKSALDRAKLPESVAKEFFVEVSEEDECICGRPLNDALRQALRQRASNYFGNDDVALLNALKTDISTVLGGTPRPSERLESALKAMSDKDNEVRRAQLDFDNLRHKVIEDNPELEEVEIKINALKERLKETSFQLEKYSITEDSAKDEDVFGIKVLEKRFKESERALAEITQTLELKAKLDILRRILERARVNAQRILSKQICDETNATLKATMPTNLIRVAGIENCLRLDGQEGGSVGETLTVGYAFLSALFKHGGYQLPFIVDSQANPIDIRVRRKAAELIPRLTHQFIAFTISSERQGFTQTLEELLPKQVQYLTVFRANDDELVARANQTGRSVSTEDAVVVADKAFFDSFHLDAEGT